MTTQKPTAHKELTNSQAKFEIDLHEAVISGTCNDVNMTSCYSKNIRGLYPAWVQLQIKWNESMTFSEAVQILSQNGLKMHVYCALD